MKDLNHLSIRKYLLDNHGFKEFDKKDWYAYAGAEKFLDGSEPIIKCEEDFDVIFDHNGFSFESDMGAITYTKDKHGRVDYV